MFDNAESQGSNETKDDIFYLQLVLSWPLFLHFVYSIQFTVYSAFEQLGIDRYCSLPVCIVYIQHTVYSAFEQLGIDVI